MGGWAAGRLGGPAPPTRVRWVVLSLAMLLSACRAAERTPAASRDTAATGRTDTALVTDTLIADTVMARDTAQ